MGYVSVVLYHTIFDYNFNGITIYKFQYIHILWRPKTKSIKYLLYFRKIEFLSKIKINRRRKNFVNLFWFFFLHKFIVILFRAKIYIIYLYI